MSRTPDYVISLAHPGQPLLESSCYTSRTIEDIPHGIDGRTITVRFDHIADNDGCRDFTDGWANTNQDGRKKKGQKEWNQMQKETKKNKLNKMFDKDGELFARLVAEAIANGDAVPIADGGRTGWHEAANTGEGAGLSAVDREAALAGHASTASADVDGDAAAGAARKSRRRATAMRPRYFTPEVVPNDYYNPHSRRMRVLCSAKLDDFIRTEGLTLMMASQRPGYDVIWLADKRKDGKS